MRNIFAIACLFAHTIVAQNFTHQAQLLPVTTNTLYRINITPALRMYMSSDFHDTRIFDSKDRETPYIVMNETPLKASTDFVSYPIIGQKHFEFYSEIIVENTAKEKISNIAFN